MYKKTILKNGLRVITVPDNHTQAVTVLALAKVGSKYEDKEIGGISHFLEHMFFKGTKKRPSPMAVVETLDKIGGEYNAFTGEEYTGYYAKVEASHFGLALDWVSDIFQNSTLPAEEIKKEKGVIVEEINMYLDNPMLYIQTLWRKLLYGDQPAGWDIAGTKSTVRSISRKQLSDYWEKHYTAPNSLICIAGNINEDIAIKEVQKYFFKLNKGKKINKASVVEKQDKPESLIHFKETDQTHLCLGVRGYNLFHPQKYVFQFIAAVLGGMMSSRLFMEVRERLGLAYYVSTGIESDPDTGFLITRAGVDNKNVDKAIQAILKEYKKISQELVDGKEIKKVKDYIKGKMALSLEASDALASFYSGQELLRNEILTPQEIFKEIDKVKAEDILAVAQDIFKSEKLNLALIGPFKDKKRFENLIKEF
ncbi:MAG: pitrilysin family protein [Patescibacteria group bacterium]|nr:pitrilysin family protein [Patescibacteria group bacterium]